MTPPARRGVRRVLDAYTGEHGIYGVVLVTALIAVGWEEETDLEVLLFVLGTVVVFWLAHLYAGVVAHRATAEGRASSVWGSIATTAHHSVGMLVAMLLPAAILLLAVVGLVEEYTAYFIALGSGVVTLGAIGFLNAVRNGSGWGWRILGVLVTVGLGLLVIVLSILVH